MNENSLYHQTMNPERGRAVIWLGAAIVTVIAAGSLYITRAGDKQDAPAPATTSAAAPQSSEKPNQTKSMSDNELRKKLTPQQYHVTRENGTEPPFRNEYWNNHRPGIYVDVISGEPLFASTDKFESGTGWPSFTKPIDKTHVVEKTDRNIFMDRTEVRSKE